MMPEKLQRLFSQTRLLQTEHSVDTLQKGLGSKVWIMGRDCCRCKRFNMDSVPLPQRADALNIRVRQWSPFAATGSHVIWQDAQALVWIWDDDKRKALAKKHAAPSARILPETLLRPLPEKNGVSMAACARGCEARLVADKKLIASQWWPRLPDLKHYNFFLVANNLAPAKQTPAPETLPWLQKPWARPRRSFNAYTPGSERILAAAVLAMTMVYGAWLGADILNLRNWNAKLQQNLQQLEQDAAEVLQQRRQALENITVVEELAKLTPYPPQLKLMAEVADILPKNNATLARWDYTKGRLAIAIRGQALDTTALVRKLEQSQYFTQVTVETTTAKDQLALSMETTPFAAALQTANTAAHSKEPLP